MGYGTGTWTGTWMGTSGQTPAAALDFCWVRRVAALELCRWAPAQALVEGIGGHGTWLSGRSDRSGYRNSPVIDANPPATYWYTTPLPSACFVWGGPYRGYGRVLSCSLGSSTEGVRCRRVYGGRRNHSASLYRFALTYRPTVILGPQGRLSLVFQSDHEKRYPWKTLPILISCSWYPYDSMIYCQYLSPRPRSEHLVSVGRVTGR